MTKYRLSLLHKDKEDFLLSVKTYFNRSNNSIHKARNEIKIVTYKDKKYTIKSFKPPHIINKIAYSFFRASKAKRSYENGIKISQFTPAVLGYIEFYKYGLIHESFLISEFFEYDFTIREPLEDQKFLDRKNIFEKFALFTYKLHQNDIFHNDYSPGNILIQKDGDDYTFTIVDINRMYFTTIDEKKSMQSFSKLNTTDEDLATIVSAYAKATNKDEKMQIKIASKYADLHQKKRQRKKKLKHVLKTFLKPKS